MGEPLDTRHEGGHVARDRLRDELSRRLGGDVADVEPMLGGASRQTWSFSLDGQPLVLRCDPQGALRAGGMRREAALLRAAGAAGVPVPDVVDVDDDSLVMTRLTGETIARRILRDERYVASRSRLVEQLAVAAARLHRGVAPDAVDGLPDEQDVLATMRTSLDTATEPHPALELGLLRLARTRPAATARTVVHGDLRLGNVVVDEAGLVGVLDWELAHLGDPAEDLGWMCVRSWRFGGAEPVAGVGSREQLLDAYASAGGAPLDQQTLRWWEAYGTLRWGVICVQQAATHLSGAVRSVELAAIGRRVCEVELDLLDVVVGAPPVADDIPAAKRRPHDRPAATELVDAVTEWLGGLPLGGRDAFLAKVSTRVLGIVRRELDLGPALAERHEARLARLGMSSDVELAAVIRAGDDSPAVVEAVHAAVVDKLLVADPRQLDNR